MPIYVFEASDPHKTIPNKPLKCCHIPVSKTDLMCLYRGFFGMRLSRGCKKSKTHYGKKQRVSKLNSRQKAALQTFVVLGMRMRSLPLLKLFAIVFLPIFSGAEHGGSTAGWGRSSFASLLRVLAELCCSCACMAHSKHPQSKIPA